MSSRCQNSTSSTQIRICLLYRLLHVSYLMNTDELVIVNLPAKTFNRLSQTNPLAGVLNRNDMMYMNGNMDHPKNMNSNRT